MPTFLEARKINLKTSLINKTALIIGGTSGLGESVALKLASMQASVIIAGRNEKAASSIIEKCKSINPSGNYSFLPIDLMLMKDCKRFASEFKISQQKKLDFLIITAGIMSMNGRTETDEGIDRKMAVHYYGRWKLIHEMMPLLKSSNTKVMSVLAACKGGQINESDLDLKHTFSIRNASLAAPTYNDLMVKKLGSLNPEMSFIHMYPGFVKTPLLDALPWYARIPAKLFSGLATSMTDFSDIAALTLTDSQFDKGAWLIGEKGDVCQDIPWIHTDKTIEIVWKHTEKYCSNF